MRCNRLLGLLRTWGIRLRRRGELMLRGLESLAPVVTILPQIFLAWSANNAVSLKAAADASRGQPIAV